MRKRKIRVLRRSRSFKVIEVGTNRKPLCDLKNSHHVLYPYFPDDRHQQYYFRQRPHTKALIPKRAYLGDRDYESECCIRTVTSLTALPITVCRNVLINCCHRCRICVITYLRLIIFLNVRAPRPVMCSFMLICQCCFAILKVLLKKVTTTTSY